MSLLININAAILERILIYRKDLRDYLDFYKIALRKKNFCKEYLLDLRQ